MCAKGLDEDTRFCIEKMNWAHRLIYFFVIVFGSILLYFRPFGGVVLLLSPIFFILTPLVWKSVSQRFISKNLLPLIENYKEKKGIKEKEPEKEQEKVDQPEKTKVSWFWKLINLLMGVSIESSNIYYLERISSNINPNKVKEIGNRFIDVISSSLAITSLVGMIYTWIKPIQTVDDGHKVITLLIGIMFFTPLIASYIIPTLWLLQDSGLKAMTENFNSINLGLEMRKGTMRKFLGTGGVVLGYGFLLQNIQILQDSLQTLTSYQVYLVAAGYLLAYFVIMAFPAIIFTFIYIFKFYPKMVNLAREKLVSEAGIKLGTTTVNFEKEEEKLE